MQKIKVKQTTIYNHTAEQTVAIRPKFLALNLKVKALMQIYLITSRMTTKHSKSTNFCQKTSLKRCGSTLIQRLEDTMDVSQ